MEMKLAKECMPPIVVESEAYEGVRRIARKVAGDIEKVTGTRPKVETAGLPALRGGWVILCATLGKSPLLELLSQKGLVDTGVFRKENAEEKKWEVYHIKKIELKGGALCGDFCPDGILLICGSDKRGTIYGMFALSEYIGVSPYCYWGDAEPARREEPVIGEDIETLSREPSVKYRGFFINDEWPCFGTWVTEHFGDFNAGAYEHVFELLLRLKGNYLWPAMWTASFPLDGPGSANEELADIYGVVIGYSHHEPCLRASEEWDKVRGEGTRYGNEWNFYTNEEGLLHYWEDALKRSGRYENIITIGMRGERDTSMLGPDATLGENIALLKDIITKQRALIQKYVARESGEPSLLLALYKEVEPYFHGDGETPGLKDWEGLDGVTCMLCEDNFGYVRTLPAEERRGRAGGYGMYYHLDYHGGPVSYEWVDSTPCSLIWEQMSEVYEYGVRDVWIVNVGDLKFHEVPLGFFLALAYDYDRWGYANPESCREYAAQWAGQNFPLADEALREKAALAFQEYIRINNLRRPEALHAGVYHPCHFGETDRMLKRAQDLEELSSQVMAQLEKTGEAQGYYSMVHYPAAASMNLLKMHLYAGRNHHYAAQGRPIANHYADLVRKCIRRDREYLQEWAAFRDGKWNGMQSEQHIGFTRWNDDDYRYPVIMEVEPAHCPRLSVSRKDGERTASKVYGPPMVIEVPDFRYAGVREAAIEIANTGCGVLHYHIRPESGSALPEWLALSSVEGDVEMLEEVTLRCERARLPREVQTVRLFVEGAGAVAALEISGRADPVPEELPGSGSAGASGGMIFLERDGIISISARHYSGKRDTAKGSYRLIEDYGKHGCGMKVFPSTAVFAEEEEKPELFYRFFVSEAGEYRVDFITAPSNPLANDRSVNILAAAGKGKARKVEILPADYRAGDLREAGWCAGTLEREHKSSAEFYLEAGVQELVIGAMEAGTVIEKILLYRKGKEIPASYLGPEETEQMIL